MFSLILKITLIVVFIVDHSGIVWSVKTGLGKYLRLDPEHITLKPFECSLCMTWWVGLVALLIAGEFTLNGMLIVAGFSLMSSTISTAIAVVRDFVQTILASIDKLIGKI